VTLAPATVEDTIEQNMNAVAQRLGIQVRSAWRYFDAAVLADRLAGSAQSFAEGGSAMDAGQAPMPPIDNPELALVLAGVPDSLAQTGGDLFSVIVNVAVNAWMAGHIHGEDGCTGCDGSRGPGGHDWQAGCAPSPRCSRTSASGSTATCGPEPSTTPTTPSPAADTGARYSEIYRMIHFGWAVVLTVLGSLIALDYRNLALRVYDITCMFSLGGAPGPRFTEDHMRMVWGCLAVVCAVIAVLKGWALFG
jgi:hypothetical protein